MDFLKRFVFNLLFLIGIGLVLYLLFPDMIEQVFKLYWMLFGPILVVLMLVVAALPRKKRK